METTHSPIASPSQVVPQAPCGHKALPTNSAVEGGRANLRLVADDHGTALVADASKASPRQFMEAVFGPDRMEEMRAEIHENCIRIIEVGGSLYGYPPLLVADCRKIIADRLHEKAMRSEVRL